MQRKLLFWSARLLLAFQLLWLPQMAMAAAYATGGSGKYKSDILWLTWGGGVNGTADKALAVGATSVADLPVANGVNLKVTCTLGTPTSSVSSYRPGTYATGDRQDYLYNIGGTQAANQLVSGIVNAGNGLESQFTITCHSQIGLQDVDLRGFVIADAESMAPGEYIESTAEGDWYVIETLKSGTASETYNITKTAQAGGNRIRIDSTGGDGKRDVVTFLKFSTPGPTKTMQFTIKGNGKTAIAIGLVVPFADFGDAPASYGDAMHLIDDINFSSDSIAQGSKVNVNAASYQAAQFLPPSRNYLGTRGPDSEPGSQYSTNADGDDKNGPYADEENAWPAAYKTLSILQASTALNVPVACNGNGQVYGWIDFDINGTFDLSERAVAPCTAGSAALNWTIPLGMKAGTTYVRLRYSLLTANLGPAGVAEDGEVEDHRITVQSPLLSIAKSNNAGNGVWVIGQTDAQYTLTVSNRGPVDTGPSPVSQPITVLDTLPAGISPQWTGALNTNGWACTYAGALVTCVTSNHLTANGGSSVIVLPVNVLPAAANTATAVNYASVGGGLDPNNGGLPPAPGNCAQPSYCAQTTVAIKRPVIGVSKTANPADLSEVKVGDAIIYTLRVTVGAATTLSPVVLSDTLGAGLIYAGITANTAGFVEAGSGNSRTFTLPEGKAPGVYSVSYKATVDVTAVTRVENKVIPSGGGERGDPSQPVPTCVGSCGTSHPVLSPLIAVSKSSNPASGATVKAEQTITYTLTAEISRSQTLSPVVLKDTLGAGLNFGVVVANNGYVIGGSGNNRVFTLPEGTAPGSYSISYTAMVKADAAPGADIRNQVVPSGGGTPVDPPPICRGCSTNHELAPPKVEYAKTTTAVQAKVGEDIDFQVTVKVSDAQTTIPVVITDTLGLGLVYKAGSASGDLTVTSAGGNQLTLTLPANKAPGTYRVRYLATVTAVVPTVNQVTNAVTGTGGGGLVPTCLSGTCQTTTPVKPSVVRYDKSTTATEVKVGDLMTFTLNVTVSDAPTAGEMTLTDTLGAGLEFVAVTPPIPAGWTAVGSGKLLTVTIPSGQSISTYKLSYTAKVTVAASGSVKNAVLGTGSDNPGCASSCSTETPVAKPQVMFTKTSTTVSAKVGDIIPYRLSIEVKNAALTEAVGSMVDNLGLGLEFVDMTSIAAPAVYTVSGQTLLVTLPKNTVPGFYVAEYRARVTPQAVSSVQNRVEGVPTPGGLTPVCAAPCQVVTPVIREIDAVDNAFADVKSSSGSAFAGNAYDNDTLNGKPFVAVDIVGTVVTPAVPLYGGSVPVLDVKTGAVSVAPGTPAGNYVIEYRICDKRDATICDTAKITIRVVAPLIKAVDDSYVANRGQGSTQVVGDAYGENDLLEGLPFAAPVITGVVLTPATSIGGNPLVPTLDTLNGQVLVQPHTPAGDYYITYRICEKLNPTNCDTAVIKVVVAPDASVLRIIKTASVRNVKIGDLVRYTLQVENVGAVPVVNASLMDTPATGFTFVAGSLNSFSLGSAVTASGVYPVKFSGITLAVGGTGTLSYLTRVGAGVRPGNLVNRAFAMNSDGDSISNVATATVQLSDDPLLDQSLIFGTVFDDRDRDGWQDSAAITGLKLQGGFAPSAYVPGSTSVDRGQGHVPVADASAPLLHGLDLGSVAARQSQADPVSRHTLTVRQKLRSLDFTDDFQLRTDQGVNLRMNAAGQVSVEKSGEAAAGRNAVEIEVQRQVSQDEGLYVVDYQVRSVGIDERGIPGVRVASVEGLLMETDLYGRFHVAGVQGGPWERGRHYILKVDPSTLPAGAEFSTSNPLLRRITPGLPVRFDFGVQMTPVFMQGEQQLVEIELGTVLFAAGEAQVRSAFLPVIAQVAEKVRQYGGGELLVQADGETEALAFERAAAVRQVLLQSLPVALHAKTRVTVRTRIADPNSLVSGVTEGGALLGTVLFDTDKAVLRPEFQPLLAKVAAHLAGLDGGVVYIVGHTDVRASHAYNQRLGLARAKAVHEALLQHLPKEIGQKTRVELIPDGDSVQGAAHRTAVPTPSK